MASSRSDPGRLGGISASRVQGGEGEREVDGWVGGERRGEGEGGRGGRVKSKRSILLAQPYPRGRNVQFV